MECRICHQSIGFVRGRFPNRKKTTTLAVHENEIPTLMQQTNSVLVNPHPGAQRKLRQELEAHHPGQTTMQHAAHVSANGDQLASAEAAAQSTTEMSTPAEPERAEARAHASR
jgi:hypothetical protein